MRPLFQTPFGGKQMRKLALFMGSLAITLAAGAGSSSAVPFNVVFVDGYAGFDSATCGAAPQTPGTTAPCATLNQALQNSSPGGSIVVVRGNAFGPIYLTGSISIQGPEDRSLQIINSGAAPGCIGAAPGTCAASTTAAVEINAASTDQIKLKNLLASAGSSGSAAILIDAAGGVTMSAVTGRGGTSTGTGAIVTATPSAGSLQLYIHNCDIAFSKTMGDVLLQPSGSANASVEFSGGELHHAVYGLQINSNATTGSLAGAFDTTQFFAFNNSAVSVSATGSGVAHVVFSRSTIVNTAGAALKVNGANAQAEIFEDVFTGDGAGINVVGGAQVVGFGNSAIFGNGVNCEVGGVPTACSTAITSQPMN
jgi:hypothetical protein